MADDPKKDEQKEEEQTEAAQEPEEEAAEEKTEEVVEEKAEPTQEQPKEEVKVEEPKKKEPIHPPTGGEKPKARAKPLSVKLEKIVKEVESLSVLELSDLVKALEERFGVTAAAPQVAAVAAPPGQAAPAAGAEGPAEEQTTFNVFLANSGANKISVIKALREINPQLGLKEAKDIVDAPPKEILTGVNKETATEAKQKLEAAGAQVELK